MSDEIVLWDGKLRLRVSSIDAIMERDFKTKIYVRGCDKPFVCDSRKDLDALRKLSFAMQPTTEGHNWEVDVEKILACLEEGMPDIGYKGGYEVHKNMVVRPYVDENEGLMFGYWRARL